MTALAKAAKVFNVPILLTTGVAKHQPLLKELQAVFPDQKPIDRTGLCSWDDQRVVDWVKQTGRKKLVIAGLWTEICLNLAVQAALGDGYTCTLSRMPPAELTQRATQWLSSVWCRRAPSPSARWRIRSNSSGTGRAKKLSRQSSRFSKSTDMASAEPFAGSRICWA